VPPTHRMRRVPGVAIARAGAARIPRTPRVAAVLAALAGAALAASAVPAAGPVIGHPIAIKSGAAFNGWSYSLAAAHARLGSVRGYCLDYAIVPPGLEPSTQTGCFFGSLARTEKVVLYQVTFGYGGAETLAVGAIIPSARTVHLAVAGRPTVRARTLRAPAALHTTLRFYAVPLDGSAVVRRVVAYDRRGRRVARTTNSG
jgi:hypothetical protein